MSVTLPQDVLRHMISYLTLDETKDLATTNRFFRAIALKEYVQRILSETQLTLFSPLLGRLSSTKFHRVATLEVFSFQEHKTIRKIRAAVDETGKILPQTTLNEKTALVQPQLHLINLETGALMTTLEALHTYPVCTRLSNDGKTAYTASHRLDGTIRHWNLETGACDRTLRFDQSGQIKWINKDGTKGIWTHKNQIVFANLLLHTPITTLALEEQQAVEAIEVNSSETSALCLLNSGSCWDIPQQSYLLWDLSSNETRTFPLANNVPGRKIVSMQISPNQKTALFGYNTNELAIYNLGSRKMQYSTYVTLKIIPEKPEEKKD